MKESTSIWSRRSSSNGKPFEKVRPVCGKVMLHRIAQREEAAAGALQPVTERDQLLPAVDADPPAVTQIAAELLGLDVEIGHVGIAPDKRVKRLDIGRGRAILFAAINLHGPGFAQLDRNDARGRVRAKKERVFLESHGPATTRRNCGESSGGVRVLVIVLVLVLVIEVSRSTIDHEQDTSTITKGR